MRIDAHAHVYDLARFPLKGKNGYDVLGSELGTVEQFACVLDAHGFGHGLLVNPLGGYGTDNACLLEALGRYPGRFKGVAVVAHGTPEAEFGRMAQAGVIGLRFNLNFPISPGLQGGEAGRTLGLARELGWFAQVHYEGDKILESLVALKASGLPIVVDHCGRPVVSEGLHQAGFQALLALGREGSAVIKLSSVFRFAKAGYPYHEADPFVAALIDAFTIERCVWGSDWPYLRSPHRVDHATLLQALERWVPAAADRQKVLGDNAARIFGFKQT